MGERQAAAAERAGSSQEATRQQQRQQQQQQPQQQPQQRSNRNSNRNGNSRLTGQNNSLGSQAPVATVTTQAEYGQNGCSASRRGSVGGDRPRARPAGQLHRDGRRQGGLPRPSGRQA